MHCLLYAFSFKFQFNREKNMSLVTHLETLQHKHALLSEAVEYESRRPSPDFMKITALKKQKLAIKEEISSLGGDWNLPQVASS
jgi:hypothetical protein